MQSIIPPFSQTLAEHGIRLSRMPAQILQINTGLLCNQACKHCHLDAGPDKPQVMDRHTMDQVAAFQEKCRLPCVDITGGAPELNPRLELGKLLLYR